MENSNQFDFVTVEDEANEVEVMSVKTLYSILQVESGEPASVYFMVVPKVLGYIDIKVTARSDTDSAGDARTKKIFLQLAK